MPIQTGQERDALRGSVAHLFERQSVLREHEILAEALNQSLGSLDLEELKQAASNDEAGLVRLAAPAENPLLSECCTRQGLELEQWAVKYVDATKGSCPALNSRFVPAGHLSRGTKAGCCFHSRHRRPGIQFSRRSWGWKNHDTAGSAARVEGGRSLRLCDYAHGIGGTGLAKRRVYPSDDR